MVCKPSNLEAFFLMVNGVPDCMLSAEQIYGKHVLLVISLFGIGSELGGPLHST